MAESKLPLKRDKFLKHLDNAQTLCSRIQKKNSDLLLNKTDIDAFFETKQRYGISVRPKPGSIRRIGFRKHGFFF